MVCWLLVLLLVLLVELLVELSVLEVSLDAEVLVDAAAAGMFRSIEVPSA